MSLSGVVSPDGRTAVVLGSTPTEAQAVFAVDPMGTTRARRLGRGPGGGGGTGPVLGFRAPGRLDGGRRVPGLFFPPVNPDVAPGGTPPPLVVFCHGGPTSSVEAGYDPVVQFLTSRGIAVAAVDYRGSSGHGRAYRDLLRGAWGEGDVDDCVAYAESLAADGLVDGDRMAIRGTSAGGLTALTALIRARCFAGAVAWYGVTDLLALAADTHDFESRYLDSLVGPLPGAEAAYRSRSPIRHADRLVGRVLLLQGSADPVVPASQAEQFADELRGRRGRMPTRRLRRGVPRVPPGRHDRGRPDRRARLLPGAVRPGAALMAADRRSRLHGSERGALDRLRALTPEGRDAFLYGVSALFAGVTALAMRIPLYREWGRLAVGPYAAATLLMVVVTLVAAPVWPGPAPGGGLPPLRFRGARRAARLVAFVVVLLGATVVPLALEVVWALEATPRSTSSPKCWSSSGPASGPPTATTRTRWSTATATS